jgi:hypothetical protein
LISVLVRVPKARCNIVLSGCTSEAEKLPCDGIAITAALDLVVAVDYLVNPVVAASRFAAGA